jgi:2-amino-4-hydroxy-6-hydroxymethyldihydropteridine diphosphokinase
MSERAAVTAYIALGANLGDRHATLQQAMQALGAMAGSGAMRSSRFYRSAPVDAVAELTTALTAPDLLRALQALENAAGRQRPYRNAPRTLDLDLLLYGDARIDSAELTVPHPRMWERAFVLVPLTELAPQCVPEAALAAVAAQAIALAS